MDLKTRQQAVAQSWVELHTCVGQKTELGVGKEEPVSTAAATKYCELAEGHITFSLVLYLENKGME